MGLQIWHSDPAEKQPGEESVDYKQDSSMLKRSTKTGVQQTSPSEKKEKEQKTYIQ